MWDDTSALVPQHPDHLVLLKALRRSKARHNRSLFHPAALSWLVLSRMLKIPSRTKNTTTGSPYLDMTLIWLVIGAECSFSCAF